MTVPLKTEQIVSITGGRASLGQASFVFVREIENCTLFPQSFESSGFSSAAACSSFPFIKGLSIDADIVLFCSFHKQVCMRDVASSVFVSVNSLITASRSSCIVCTCLSGSGGSLFSCSSCFGAVTGGMLWLGW